MQKMTLQSLKDLFTPPPMHYVSPDGLYDKTERTKWGSKRQARHNHKPSFKPRNITTVNRVPLGSYVSREVFVSPALYRRLHLGAK